METERRSGDDRRSVINEMASDIKMIKTLLLGNGKVGLCGKVQIMWHTTIFFVVGLCGVVGAWMWGQLLK